MTIILTLFGLLVFVFSLFTVGFKSALKRLCLFALVGFVIDVFIGMAAVMFTQGHLF